MQVEVLERLGREEGRVGVGLLVGERDLQRAGRGSAWELRDSWQGERTHLDLVGQVLEQCGCCVEAGVIEWAVQRREEEGDAPGGASSAGGSSRCAGSPCSGAC